MKTLSLLGLAGLMAVTASAGLISYNTNGSSLTCGLSTPNCVQNNQTSLTVGTGGNTITLVYNASGANNINAPSLINLGFLDATAIGSPGLTSLAGVILNINVNNTQPANGSGQIQSGTISGSIGISQSGAIIQFAPSNTTTGFGTLPGVVIVVGGFSATYQVLQTTLGLVPPTSGGPQGVGETSIQGAVTDSPEPTTLVLMGAGLGLVGLLRRRAVR